MSNVEFEADQLGSSNLSRFSSQYTSSQYNSQQSQKASGIPGFLLKLGIIKNESQAKGVMTGIFIFNFLVTFLIFYFFVVK
jgi:hypothetical protein